MVGVPGKYKGCETCRARRVKCDNQRPYCKKCVDNGRECAGYERETVFIIGTIQDEGRCSSHPPRIVKSGSRRGGKASSSKASSRAASRSVSPAVKREDKEEKLELVPIPPLQPAWDDLITLSDSRKNYRVQTAALHTNLQSVVRSRDEADATKFSFLALPPYEPPNVQPFFAEEDFDLRAQCLVHLDGEPSYSLDMEETDTGTDSICLFLYEHNNSTLFTNQAPWLDPSVQSNPIRQLGPENFRTFPNHHFFVRVYRHNAISSALLNRKPTFLSSPEWQTVPWEIHPKSYLDTLFDILSSLPAIIHRADQIFILDPTLQRRLMAQDLLTNCLALEHQLDIWYAGLTAANNGMTFFPDTATPEIPIPFPDALAFPDSLTAVTMIYYWTGLVLFYPCIERLHNLMYGPVINPIPLSFPSFPPQALSPHLLLDPIKYSAKEVRELAGMICRGLDFALNGTTQPDLLVMPLFVVEEFYRFLGTSGDDLWDGQLEVMWCEGFRVRLGMKGRDIGEVIGDGGKGWVEGGRW